MNSTVHPHPPPSRGRGLSHIFMLCAYLPRPRPIASEGPADVGRGVIRDFRLFQKSQIRFDKGMLINNNYNS